MDFILHAVQTLLCLIDECIYNIASMFYSLLIYISESNIFDQNVIQGFATRLYALLGVFMLFKVSFSLINYIVNPDDFTKGEKGVGKLVPNVMISLVLIVFTPRIFAEVMDLQHLIISQHFFEKVIFSGNYESYISQDMGDIIAVQTFNAFYYYDEEDKKNDGRLPVKAKDSGVLSSEPIPGTQKYTYISLEAAFDHNSPYNAYDGIWDDTSTYTPIISTAAGIILLLVLIQFCFDIAIRTVKFGFLQLIAPIPIISRMDPKSAKNGLFSRWVKECIETYVGLFGRLIALFFAVYIIQIILNTSFQVPEKSLFTVMIVKALLILGTLLFAKQLPKFLNELFKINLSSGFTLNPMKRLREVPGANRIGGALGSAYQRAVGTFQQQRRDFGTNKGRSVLRALGSGARGLVPGAIGGRGFRGQMNATKNSMNELNEAAYKLRQENPNLTHEEALKLAQQKIRENRRNERFGLETEQERIKREKNELAVEAARFEKEEKGRQQEIEREKRLFEQSEQELIIRREKLEEKGKLREHRQRDIKKVKDATTTVENAYKNLNKTSKDTATTESKADSLTSAAEIVQRKQDIKKDVDELEQLRKNNVDNQTKLAENLKDYKAKYDSLDRNSNDATTKLNTEIADLTAKLNSATTDVDKQIYAEQLIDKQEKLSRITNASNAEKAKLSESIDKIQKEIDKSDVDFKNREKVLVSSIAAKQEDLDNFSKKIGNKYQENNVFRNEVSSTNLNTDLAAGDNIVVGADGNYHSEISYTDENGNRMTTDSYQTAYMETNKSVHKADKELNDISKQLTEAQRKLSDMKPTDAGYQQALQERNDLYTRQDNAVKSLAKLMKEREDVLVKFNQQNLIEDQVEKYNNYHDKVENDLHGYTTTKNNLQAQISAIESQLASTTITAQERSALEEQHLQLTNDKNKVEFDEKLAQEQLNEMNEFKASYDEYQTKLEEYKVAIQSGDTTRANNIKDEIVKYKETIYKDDYYQNKRTEYDTKYEENLNIINDASSTQEQIELARTENQTIVKNLLRLSKETKLEELDQEIITLNKTVEETVETNKEHLSGTIAHVIKRADTIYNMTKDPKRDKDGNIISQTLESIVKENEQFINEINAEGFKDDDELHNIGEELRNLQQAKTQSERAHSVEERVSKDYKEHYIDDPNKKLDKQATSAEGVHKAEESIRNESTNNGKK